MLVLVAAASATAASAALLVVMPMIVCVVVGVAVVMTVAVRVRVASAAAAARAMCSAVVVTMAVARQGGVDGACEVHALGVFGPASSPLACAERDHVPAVRLQHALLCFQISHRFGVDFACGAALDLQCHLHTTSAISCPPWM